LLNHNAHAWSKSLIEGVRCFIREQNDWVPVPCGPESVVDRELVGGLGLDALLGFYQEDAMPRDMSDLPPFVTWSGVSPIEGIVQVIPDHRRSAEFVAEHLYSRGHRVLACFEHQNPRRIGARIREDRLKELAGELGCGYHRFTSGLNTSDRWSLHGQVADLADWLRALPTPVGVMCSDDYHSWRILEAANRVGLNVPNDIGLVGCRNDVDFSESTRPTLSSIALDGFGQGYEACVPVSYTHLRAHETKANLVCRLLLEKQKTHISNINSHRPTTTASPPRVPNLTHNTWHKHQDTIPY